MVVGKLLTGAALALFVTGSAVADEARGAPVPVAQTEQAAGSQAEMVHRVQRDPSDVEKRLQEASLLLRGGRFEDALKQAQGIVDLEPQRYEGHLLAGRARTGLGDREGALDALERALALAPESEAVWIDLARAHAAGGDRDRAEQVLRKGIATIPPTALLRAALAELIAQRKDYAAADQLMVEVENLSGDRLSILRAVALYRLKRGDPEAAEKLLLWALGAAGEGGDRLAALDELAEFYSQVGDLRRAKEVLQRSQLLAPDHVLTLARLANLHLLEGDRAAAAPLIDKLLVLSPEDRNARLLRARLDIVEGHLAEGTEALEQLVREAPDSVNGNLFLGKAYALAGAWEKAREAYRKVLREVPDHLFAQLDLAKVSLETGQADTALETIGRVLRVRPNLREAHLVRSRALLLSGRAAEAESELRWLLEDDLDNPALYLQLAQALAAQGREEEAVDAIRRARELAPVATEPLLLELRILARHGRAGEVARVGEEFLRLRGEVPAVLNALAAFHLSRRATEQAAVFLDRSLRAAPEEPATRELEAQIRLAQGRPEAAREALEVALRDHPQRISALFPLAGIHEQSGDLGGAAAAYRRILSVEPRNPRAANNLAMLYSVDPARRAEALGLALQAVEAAPDNPFTRDTLGWVQHLNGLHEAAAENLEQARLAAPEHPEIAYHLGVLYAELGKREQAIQLLREALAGQRESAGWSADALRALRELENGQPGEPARP